MIDEKNKNSVFIDSQLPRFINQNHEQFTNFLRFYYEWLESSENATGVLRSIHEQGNIEKSTGKFLDLLYDELASKFPKNILIDKKLFLQKATDYYKSKGVEDSYRYLFLILFGKEAAKSLSFYYPNRDILRLSDSTWTVNRTMRVTSVSGDLFSLSNTKIAGNDSLSTATVVSVLGFSVGPHFVYELLLDNQTIDGEFDAGENITAENGVIGKIVPVLSSVTVTAGGTGFALTDDVTETDSTGIGAKLKIAEVDDTGKIIKIDIIDPGAFYTSPTISVSGSGTGETLTAVIGAVTVYPGFFKDTTGHLSSSAQRLQDNYFYQQFSYVLRAPESISLYRKILEEQVHPAGLIMFGEFSSLAEVDALGNSDFDVTASVVKSWINEMNYADLQLVESIALKLQIEADPVNAYSTIADWISWQFYPFQSAFVDPFMSSGSNYWEGNYEFSSRDQVPYYKNGLSNTLLSDFEFINQDLNFYPVQPDSVVYSFPFTQENCRLWLDGNYGRVNTSLQAKFEENLGNTNLYIADSSRLNFSGAAFSVSCSIVCDNIDEEPILGLWGNGNTDISDPIWGNGDANVDEANDFRVFENEKSYALGHDTNFFVKIADPTDSNPATDGTFTYTHTTTIVPGTEYFVAFYYNPITLKIGISVNGVLQEFSHTTGINDTNNSYFMVGSVDTPTYLADVYTKPILFNGLIKNVSIYEKTLTADDISKLANGNAGRLYNQMSVYNKHSLVCHWNLDEEDDCRYDSHTFKLDLFKVDPALNISTENFYTRHYEPVKRINAWRDMTFWNGNWQKLLAEQIVYEYSPYTTRNDNKENLLVQSDKLDKFLAFETTKAYAVGSPINEYANYLELYETVTNGLHYIEEEVQVYQGETYNFSLYVKSIGGTDIRVEFLDNLGDFYIAADLTENLIFNLSLVGTVDLEVLSDGWIRIFGEVPALTTGITTIRISCCDVTSIAGTFDTVTFSYAGDTENGLALFGAQLRRSTSDSIYIPTKDLPQYRGINGNVGIVFDGNDVLETNSTEVLNIDNKTIFCVVEIFDEKTSKEIILSNDTDNFNVGVDELNTSSNFLDIGETLGTTDSVIENGKYILEYSYDSTGDLIHRVNGAIDAQETISSHDAIVGASTWFIGGRNDADDLFNGIIYEIIVLESVDSAELEITRDFLSNKYNIITV